ncbi:MAG: DMT family transporter [Pseudomonadota bacterium]
MNPVMQGVTVVMLAVFWALNWPMMKIGLTAVEPWTFRAVIVLVGGLGCLLVAHLAGRSIAIPASDLRPLLWLTLFQGVLWNAFSGFGIAMVEAGRAAVLGFTMPVWATLLSILFLKEHVTLRRGLGLALGMVAMGLLLWPAFESLGSEMTGTLLMIGGAICWGVATVIVKSVDWKMGVLELSGWQFLIASGPLILAAVTVGEPATLKNIDMRTGSAMAFSALIPMIFCQAVWFAVVRRLPASLASTGTLLVPPLGVYFAALILGETVGLFEVLALLLVIAALVMILPGFNWRASLHPPPASRPE